MEMVKYEIILEEAWFINHPRDIPTFCESIIYMKICVYRIGFRQLFTTNNLQTNIRSSDKQLAL